MRAGTTEYEVGAVERSASAARFALARIAPLLSARRRLHITQGFILAIIAGVFAVLCYTAPGVIRALLFVLFSAFTVWRLCAAICVFPLNRKGVTGAWQGDLPIYTILCPLYREAGMAAPLAARLCRLNYPAARLDLKIVLEHGDQETLDAVRAVEWPEQAEIIIAPPGAPQTKPKALNFALTFARGQFVTIYDAEDAPHPDQLRAALDAFAGREDLACVQAPLLIDRAERSWLSTQFAAEYAVQFLTLTPFMARLGMPFMLGGTSNHFRVSALCAAGGWDPFNVTEDADIGYRLARDDGRLGAIAPPTWEEAPPALWPWLRQRTRWIKGHIQTWLVLMRDPFATLRDLGMAGFISMQIMLGGAIVSAFTHGPIFVVIACALVSPTFDLGPLDWSLAIAGYVTGAYSVVAAAIAARDWRIVLSLATMPLYWPLSSIAALMAALDLIVRPHYWAKTEHGLSARSAIPA